MRYIAKVLKNTLHEKFPDATEDELLKVRGLNFTQIISSCTDVEGWESSALPSNSCSQSRSPPDS